MRRWEKSENEEFTEEWLNARKSVAALAKKYKRSEKQIREHAYRMGLPSYRDVSCMNSRKYITDCFGYDSKAAYTVFKDAPFITKSNGKQQVSHISHVKFWAWAKNNRENIDFSRYMKGSIEHEPKWVDEEIKKIKRVVPKKWTVLEDKRLIMYYKMGLSITDIAAKMDRSYSAIAHRVGRIKGIEKKKICLRWQEEEVEMLLKLKAEGRTHYDIAHELGRDFTHIADKIRRMKLNN